MEQLIILLVFLISINSFAESHFKTGSAVATPELISELEKVFNDKIKNKDIDSVIVEGHTDSRGTDKTNQKLSIARAKAAMNKLIDLGVDKNKIVAVGKGESELLSPGLSDLDHSKNRRIVIVVGSNEGATAVVISENKECKPKETIKEKLVVKKHNHILSLTVVRSLTDYDISQLSVTTTRVENNYEYAPGVMYQNNITGDVYLGIQVDTHKSVGGSIGYGF